MTVNVHIEQLVLNGLSVPYHQQPLLQKAIEMELGHLLTTNGLAKGLVNSSAVSHILAGDIELTNENDLIHLSQQIARAVYQGVDR
jgi:hypothetical protein